MRLPLFVVFRVNSFVVIRSSQRGSYENACVTLSVFWEFPSSVEENFCCSVIFFCIAVYNETNFWNIVSREYLIEIKCRYETKNSYEAYRTCAYFLEIFSLLEQTPI